MSAESIIKKQARDILKHNYPAALISLFLLGSVFVVYDTTTSILSIIIMRLTDSMSENMQMTILYGIGIPVSVIIFYLLSPIYNGYVRMYYNMVNTGEADLRDAFYYMRKGAYLYALKLNTSIILRMLIPVLIISIPPVTFEILSARALSGFYGTVPYQLILFILTALSVFLVFLWSMKYFVVYTLSVDYDYMKPSELVRYSKYITNGNTHRISALYFSLLPWVLLCITILPMLYVIPYITTSFCVSAKWLTKTAFERTTQE